MSYKLRLRLTMGCNFIFVILLLLLSYCDFGYIKGVQGNKRYEDKATLAGFDSKPPTDKLVWKGLKASDDIDGWCSLLVKMESCERINPFNPGVKHQNTFNSGTDKPKQLTVQIINATSLALRWLPPRASEQAHCPIQRYIIRLRQDGVKRSRAWRLDGDRRSVTLHDLHPSTAYQVRLMGIDCDGKKKSSRWVPFKTADLPDVPGTGEYGGQERQAPGQPTNVRTRTMSDSIVVTWQPPIDSALVRGYMIGYGEGVPDVNWRYVSVTQREVTINALKPSTQYVISVRALNNFGKGQVVYDIVTTKSVHPGGGNLPAPVMLQSQILSTTTVLLRWTDPSLDHQQKITDERYYNVYYQALVPNSKNLSVIVKALHVTLYDLQPGRVYQFKVRTVKGAQTSQFSDVISNKTSLEGLPVSESTNHIDPAESDLDAEYDGDDIRNVGDMGAGGGGQRRSPGDKVKDESFHAEIKRKRAHNVVQESLARTIITSNDTAFSLPQTGGESRISVPFRSMVQYRVSAYVTWPEKMDGCAADADKVAGYIFRYKAVDDVGEYIARNLAANFVLLENLLPNTKYRYQVKYVMDRGRVSDWSQEALLDTSYYNPVV